MGLDADFLGMLEATVEVYRVSGKDQWGNENEAAPTTERAFIDEETANFGGEDTSDRQEGKKAGTTSLIMDAVGMSPGDRVMFGGKDHWVTQVVLARDEFGENLFETVTVSDQKEG